MLTLPANQVLERGPNRVVFALSIPPQLDCFQGHFPNLPILAGVVQVDWAMRFAARDLVMAGTLDHIDNLKFQRAIIADMALQLRLQKVDASIFEFAYYSDGTICSRGTVALSVAAAAA